MRLRSFIIDTQRITATKGKNSFTAESSQYAVDGITEIAPNLGDPPQVFQGATLEFVDGASDDHAFYSMAVSGSLTTGNVLSPDGKLKMTGSLSSTVDFGTSATTPIAFQVLMVAKGISTG